MERERRKQALLAGLTLVLAAALYYAWSTVGLSPAGGPSSAGPASRAAARRTSGSEAPSLHLNDLEASGPSQSGAAEICFVSSQNRARWHPYGRGQYPRHQFPPDRLGRRRRPRSR